MNKKIIGIFVIILFIGVGVLPSVSGNVLFEKEDLCIDTSTDITPGPYFGFLTLFETGIEYDIYTVKWFFIFFGDPSFTLHKGNVMLVGLKKDNHDIHIGSFVFCWRGIASLILF